MTYRFLEMFLAEVGPQESLGSVFNIFFMWFMDRGHRLVVLPTLVPAAAFSAAAESASESATAEAAAALAAAAEAAATTFAATLHWCDSITLAGHIAGLVLLLLVVPGEVVGNGLRFVQGAEAISIDNRLMDENILTTVGWRDEAEALLGVEKLDGSLARHLVFFYLLLDNNFLKLRLTTKN